MADDDKTNPHDEAEIKALEAQETDTDAEATDADDETTQIEEPEEAKDYDDDDLRNLSEEERAAFLAEDEESADAIDDETAALEEDAATAAEAEKAQQPADDDAAQQAADAAQHAEASAVEVETAQKVEEPHAPAEQPKAPQVTSEDFNAAMQQSSTLKAEAWEKFSDGEMSDEEYLAKLKEIDDSVMQRANEAAAERFYEARRTSFSEEARKYLSEIPELATPDHLDNFDAWVREVTANPINDGLTHRQLLEKAHRAYLLDQDVVKTVIPALPGKAPKADPAPTPAAQQTPQPKTTNDPPPVRPASERPDPVTTLKQMPAAATTSAADGKYSQLEAMIDNAPDAESVERIMASMSEDEREYFASYDG